MTEREALLKTLRALLAFGRACADSGGHYDYDVEEALNAAKEVGIDVEAEKERARDRSTLAWREFEKKWKTG